MRNYMIVPMVLLFNITYSQQVDLINETFDNGIPSSWTHYSTNWGIYPQWAVASEALRESSGPYFVPVWNWIQLPAVDLTEVSSPMIEFDLAMAFVDTTILFSVWYTTDSIWNPIITGLGTTATYGSYTSGASNIIDVDSAVDNNWTPLSTDYQTISIDLLQFADESNIRFSLCSHYGNYFAYGVWYIDNVKIYGNSIMGILNHTEHASFKIFPNPTSSVVRLIPSEQIKNSTWKITNITGAVILEINSDSAIEEVDVSSYDPGIYFVHHIYQGRKSIKRLVIH